MSRALKICLAALAISLLGACATTRTIPAVLPAQSSGPETFNIAGFGAVGDGKTMNTQAIESAITAASNAGGGQVEIPRGIFLTGPFNLASNIDLHLDAGSVLLFSRNYDDYPLVYANFLGKDTIQCRSPITATHCSNVSITGPGAIDGQGDAWRPVKHWKVTGEMWSNLLQSGGVVAGKGLEETWYHTSAARDGDKAVEKLRESDNLPSMEDYAPYRDSLRPDLVYIVSCDHVLIDGPTFRNSGFWAIHLLWSHDIAVRNSCILNDLWAQNGDGIGFDSCQNVLMEKTAVYAGDDNVSVKSGKDEEGRKRHIPTENVTIRNCLSGWGHGGYVIGSETSGDIRNIHITDCACRGTDVGLRFKSVRGRGGAVEDIHVSDIYMSDIVHIAVSFDMYYEAPNSRPEPRSERTPTFRDFHLDNIYCTSSGQSLMVHGLPELPMYQITMQNMQLKGKLGAALTDAADITLRNVKIDSGKYPALAVQDVTGLTLDSVDTTCPPAPATRPSSSAPTTAP
jgi:polygalacturonase